MWHGSRSCRCIRVCSLLLSILLSCIARTRAADVPILSPEQHHRTSTRVIDHHSFTPPLLRDYYGDGEVRQWKIGGTAVATENYVRLTGDFNSQWGSLWNTVPINIPTFEIIVGFHVHGNGRYGADGFGLWLTTNIMNMNGPLMGHPSDFEGVGILFDTFDNSGRGNHPAVYVIYNAEGVKREYSPLKDFEDEHIGSCSFPVRQTSTKLSTARVRYENGVLSVFLSSDAEKSEKLCFAVNVNLNVNKKNHYIGLTAATGGSSDNHDIVFVHTMPIEGEKYDHDVFAQPEMPTEEPQKHEEKMTVAADEPVQGGNSTVLVEGSEELERGKSNTTVSDGRQEVHRDEQPREDHRGDHHDGRQEVHRDEQPREDHRGDHHDGRQEAHRDEQPREGRRDSSQAGRRRDSHPYRDDRDENDDRYGFDDLHERHDENDGKLDYNEFNDESELGHRSGDDSGRRNGRDNQLDNRRVGRREGDDYSDENDNDQYGSSFKSERANEYGRQKYKQARSREPVYRRRSSEEGRDVGSEYRRDSDTPDTKPRYAQWRRDGDTARSYNRDGTRGDGRRTGARGAEGQGSETNQHQAEARGGNARKTTKRTSR
ncbi:putative mannose-specific lectin [Trypanosoma vivax]|uniref:Putative mannose-specific lectin n=1 Tax=Trypanosoma vivax (strain Y486) TaxID=1055687 RepID=G0UAV5_TRYVY|nr:putative mannose-specific lectin [Trypanosoma vivax]CCC52942.1 putative mannose-specific lectin [Trypanosoma vivax Y486]